MSTPIQKKIEQIGERFEKKFCAVDGHETIKTFLNPRDIAIKSFLNTSLLELLAVANEERDRGWKDAIQNLINVSNENAPQSWYDGLRACKSIAPSDIKQVLEQ